MTEPCPCCTHYDDANGTAACIHCKHRAPDNFHQAKPAPPGKYVCDSCGALYERRESDKSPVHCTCGSLTRPLQGSQRLAIKTTLAPASWQPVHCLPPQTDNEADILCVVVWRDLCRPLEIGCETTTLEIIRDGDYSGGRYMDAEWRTLMDAPVVRETLRDRKEGERG